MLLAFFVLCNINRQGRAKMKKIINIIGIICNVSSILGLAFVQCFPEYVKILIITLGVGSGIIMFIAFYKSSEENVRICHSDYEIKKAMKSIISSKTGQIAIMSRDLSWVDDEVEICLKNNKDNVMLFAQKSTELTKKLAREGVQVRLYGEDFAPQTRFTIIRYNTNNPQTAIANTKNSIRKKHTFEHMIYQTNNESKQDKWINSLSCDMIKLCKAKSKGETND